MKIAEVSARPPQLVQQLVEVWQRSVQATHLFFVCAGNCRYPYLCSADPVREWNT